MRLTCLSILATASASKLGAQNFTIPLDISSNRPILELTIDGKGPYRFIFDTGSSGNVIDTKLAEELGLKVVGEDPLRTPGSDNRLVSKRVEASEVSFPGTDIVQSGTLNTIDLRSMLPVDGILSGAFFSEYLMTLDYPGSKLTLSQGGLNRNDKGVTSFLQKPRVINMDLNVAGHTVEAHLDTGNPSGFHLPFNLKDKLKFREDPVEDGFVRTPVAQFKKWKADLIGEITVGGVTFKNPSVHLIENFEFVNIGYQVYKDLQITVDRKNSLVLFQKSSSQSPAVAEREVQANEEVNEFTGSYDNKVRQVFIEDGQMYIQRTGGQKLSLVKIEGELFKMEFTQPVRNELPNVRFERNEQGMVKGLTYVFKDGREDYIKKDLQ